MTPALQRTLKFFILAALILQVLSWNTVDRDTWHQMSLAREIVRLGAVPKADTFAFTPTKPLVVHHEWGTGMLVYFAAAKFGPAGLLAMQYALLLAIWGVIFACSVRRAVCIGQWGYLAILGAVLRPGGFQPLRAQMFSFLGVAALLLVLQRDEEGKRRWILPALLLFPLWANLHGGSAIAIVLLGLCAVERFVRRRPFRHLLWTAAGMGALLAVNPYGMAYYGYLAQALTMARPHINEWQPAWSLPATVVAAFGICVAVLLYTAVSARLAHTPGILILAALGVEAALHAKMVPMFGVAWLCYVPGYFRKTPMAARLDRFHKEWPEMACAFWGVLAAFTLAMTVSGASRPWTLRVPAGQYPVGAVEYLRSRGFQGNLMTHFNVGAYVSWKLYPAVKVSLDSRYEAVYPDSVVEDCLSFYRAAPRWQDVLVRYPADAVLVAAGQRVGAEMPRTPWKRVYADADFAVWVRPGIELAPMERGGPVPDGTIP